MRSRIVTIVWKCKIKNKWGWAKWFLLKKSLRSLSRFRTFIRWAQNVTIRGIFILILAYMSLARKKRSYCTNYWHIYVWNLNSQSNQTITMSIHDELIYLWKRNIIKLSFLLKLYIFFFNLQSIYSTSLFGNGSVYNSIFLFLSITHLSMYLILYFLILMIKT